jgi:sugar lactone lactonase YvrE
MYLIFSFMLAAATLEAEHFEIRTIAQGSPVGSGWAVAFDSQDRLYVTTISGELLRRSGDGAWERLWKPEAGGVFFGLAVDLRDRAFVGDLLSRKVYRVDPDGSATVVAENLEGPVGLATDEVGNVFIADSTRIRLIQAEGAASTYVTGSFAGALSLDRDGNLYAADWVKGAIHKIAADRTVTKLTDAAPLALTTCPDGRVYFTDMYRVQRVGDSGPETIAGSADRLFAVEEGAARDARFTTPLALACDSRGRLVVYDSGAARLRMLTPVR